MLYRLPGQLMYKSETLVLTTIKHRDIRLRKTFSGLGCNFYGTQFVLWCQSLGLRLTLFSLRFAKWGQTCKRRYSVIRLVFIIESASNGSVGESPRDHASTCNLHSVHCKIEMFLYRIVFQYISTTFTQYLLTTLK